MFKTYLVFHLLIFTMYACSMGSQKARLYSKRDVNKTPWAGCNPELLVQKTKAYSDGKWVDVVIDKNSRDYACLRRCTPDMRTKMGRCKEYEVLTRKWTSDEIYFGNWLLVPES